ncbi:MAG: hypothetical protein Q7S24_00760 [bacterium]|nr:hypothetical protein [bacterium]
MGRKISFLFIVIVAIVLTGAGCLGFGGSVQQGTNGAYRSLNKGDSWLSAMAVPTAAGVKTIAGVNVFRLSTDPSDPNAVYLGTRGQGLLYSYDFGQSWRTVDVMAGKFIYAVAVDPNDKCTIYVSDGPHIYKTTDCTRTWTLTFTEERPDQRFVSLGVDYGNSKIVYGAVLGGDILMSNDAGRSWRAVKRFGFELQQLTADPANPKRLYVAAYSQGLYRSDDYGETWTDLNEGLQNFNDSMRFNRLVVNPGQKDSLFWISKYGILRSDDGGKKWDELKLITPPGSVNIYAFAINPENQKELYYTGTILGDKNVHVRSTFYKSTDGGKNWVTKKLPTGTIPTAMLLNLQSTSQLLMGFATLN